MDLEALKEALGEDTHAKLAAYVADLTGQRDAARRESIEGRKALKSRVTELEKAQSDMLGRLGIDSLDDLETLDPKGQAEAAKQFEAKLRKAERERDERANAYEELQGRHKATLQDAAMRKALGAHDWIDADLVASYAGARLAWEEDQILFRTDTGGLVPLDEGVATLAKAKPHLLKAAGAGGSGYRGTPGNGASGPKNPWAKASFNLTEQLRLSTEDPTLAAQLKASAGS